MHIDLIGQTFSLLTVIGPADKQDGVLNMRWRCRCVCGAIVIVRSDRLRRGIRRFCSVRVHGNPKLKEYNRSRPPTLQQIHKLTHNSWEQMRARCSATSGKHYRNYSSRGITVCARWDDFSAFLADMGPRPSIEYSIDRIDTNGNYEPSNCKWSTTKKQNRNKRSSRHLEWNGRKVLLVDLACEYRLHPSHLAGRLSMGWSLEEALTRPIRHYRKSS